MEKANSNSSEMPKSNEKFDFNIDEIINKCKEKDGIELLNYMCSIMKEKKRNILETLYQELGKDYLIFNLEKALNIENSGGLNKGKCMYPKKEEKKEKNDNIKNNNDNNDSTNEKKSTGGIFFSLVKKDPEAKNILNRATRKDFKESKQRKKVYKLMDKLNI
jgi:hypothetical protein